MTTSLPSTYVNRRYTLDRLFQTFRHRGLRELYERGRSSKVAQEHVQKLLRILTALDRSAGPEGMDLPGF